MYDPTRQQEFQMPTGFTDVMGMDGKTIWDRKENVTGTGLPDTIAQLKAIAEMDNNQYQQHMRNADILFRNPNIMGTLDDATRQELLNAYEAGDVGRILPHMERLLTNQDRTDKILSDKFSPAGQAKEQAEWDEWVNKQHY